MTTEKNLPSFVVEERVIKAGYRYVAGLDEAGRGALAGPVTAAAVLLNPADIPAGINDSKLLSARKRELLFDEISNRALAVACSSLSQDVINSTNILAASLAAMANAVRSLKITPNFLLIDGTHLLRGVSILQDAIVGGDGYCLSIAAASIIAKVTRDRLMREYDKEYPGYGFLKHKGYGTLEHREAIRTLGPCSLHRLKFKGVKEYIKNF